jgi:UDP-N-acetylglucosamine 4,6-dehydratase/5-epimerase
MLNDKVVLITGGTGSFGKKCTEIILKRYKPKKLIIFSRDELKQFEMSQTFSMAEYPCMRYFIGDVRDKERLYRAFAGSRLRYSRSSPQAGARSGIQPF